MPVPVEVEAPGSVLIATFISFVSSSESDAGELLGSRSLSTFDFSYVKSKTLDQ